MNEKDIQSLQQLLASPKKIAIVPHRSPDGDAMGSTLGLYHFLLKLNHNVVVIAPNDFPNFLAWMPGSDKVLVFENDKVTTTKILQEAELVFTLDFNALHRTGEMEHVLNKLTVPIIMVDHHQSPDTYATITYSDTAFGSTCEMIYNLIGFLNTSSFQTKFSDQKLGIDITIATCLYTGIMTDSGQFRYPKTTGTTHRIVAEFIDLGVDNSGIPNLIFDNNSFHRLQLLGRALQNMKVFPEFKTAYTCLSQKELDEFHYVKGDTEGIVNYGLTIKGIIFAIILIEHNPEESGEKIIKISFRSQGDFDVNQFARDHFNGGGHVNAAGGKSYDSLENTIKKLDHLITKITL